MKFSTKLSVILLISFCLSFVITNTAVAVNRMVFVPYVSLQTTYDSNYWLSDGDERGVYGIAVKPGFDFGYATDRSDVTFSYAISQETYYDEDDVPQGAADADDDNYLAHDLRLFAQSQLSDKILVSLDESYLLTREPGSSDIYNNEVDRNKYSLNRVTPQLIYTFREGLDIGLRYQHTLQDYNRSTEEDSTENRGIINFIYDLNRYNAIDLEYQIWRQAYDQDSSDYTSNQVTLNYNREATYLTFNLGAGYHNRSFDESTLDDLDAFTWKMGLSFENRNRMAISLSQNFNDLGSGDSYYTATRLDVSFGRLCLEKLDCTLSGNYQKSDYEDSATGRVDDRWEILGNVDYLINERFTLSFKLGYETRDSNNVGYDYDNTYALLNLKFAYDFMTR